MGGETAPRRFFSLVSISWWLLPVCIDLRRRTCTRAGVHTRGRSSPPNLTRVFIKESSCSMALRRNGDRLWHNYTNPCMSLGLMEAEHLTQTKCTGADQFRGAFFPHLSRGQLSPTTGHLHMRCISVMVITAIQEPPPPRDWYRSTAVEMKRHVSKTLTLRNPNRGEGGAADFRLPPPRYCPAPDID